MPKPGPEICGDVPLSWADQSRYVLYGLRQIVQSIRQRFTAVPLRMDVENADIRHKIEEGASPLRVYTLALVQKVLADLPSLDGPICDIGCGSGEQSRFFESLKGRSLYLGIDVACHASWPSLAVLDHPLPRRFARMTATELGIASGRLALTFSSSALEHVPDIRQAVAEMARTMRPGAYGLHILPGVWSLFLYLFHGYRRFSPAVVTELFQQAGLRVERIWALWGLPSFFLHGVWITWLETIILRKILNRGVQMRRGVSLRLYTGLLGLSLRLDPFFPVAPAGYGVLVRKL